MPRNSKWLIWVEEFLMLAVVLFGLWGVLKGAWIALIIVAVALVMMVRQWRILKAMNELDDEEEEEGDDEAYED